MQIVYFLIDSNEEKSVLEALRDMPGFKGAEGLFRLMSDIDIDALAQFEIEAEDVGTTMNAILQISGVNRVRPRTVVWEILPKSRVERDPPGEAEIPRRATDWP